MMMGLGAMEVLVLLLFGGGDVVPDAVNLVPPRDYFMARDIELSVDKMMELAAREPRDAKTQVQQLLALRQLEGDAARLQKAEKAAQYRKTIAQIAEGTVASDKHGFAQEYAQRVLAKLGGPAPTNPGTQPLFQGLTWLPSECTLVFGMTVRSSPNDGARLNPLTEKLWALVPMQAKQDVFGVLDLLGNVRIERLVVGYKQDPQGKQDGGEIYVRFTGKATPEWIGEALKTKANGTVETAKGPKGEALLYVKGPASADAPAMVFVGDTDFVVAGFDGPRGGKHQEVLHRVLALRFGKGSDVQQGALKDRLKKVPADAIALLVADLPAKNNNPGGPFTIPGLAKVDGYIQRTVIGLDLKGYATMTSPEKAESTVKDMSMGRKQAIDALKALQANPPMPGLPIQDMINMLESLQIQQEQEKVHVQLVMPGSTLQALPLFFMVGRAGAVPAQPQAQPAQPPQKK